MPRLCDVCGAPSKVVCSSCRDMNYCGRSCQKGDWKHHRAICAPVPEGDTGLSFAQFLKANRKKSGVICVMWVGPQNAPPSHQQRLYFPLEVRIDDTVDELKRKIGSRWNVDVGDLVLKHHVELSTHWREMTMHGLRDNYTRDRWGPNSPRLVGTLRNYRLDIGCTILLETAMHMPLEPTCLKCRQCVDDVCSLDLDMGPDPNDAPPLPRSAAPAGRNEPCPCGSGKKYKKCCGK